MRGSLSPSKGPNQILCDLIVAAIEDQQFSSSVNSSLKNSEHVE